MKKHENVEDERLLFFSFFFFFLFYYTSLQSNTQKKKKNDRSILAGHVAAQAKTGTELNSNRHFPVWPIPLRGEAGGRPLPQALAALDDQIMTRHVIRGFGGQINDGSLQVGGSSQSPGGDVLQPAPHQRPQVLGADERRVHDAPATRAQPPRV